MPDYEIVRCDLGGWNVVDCDAVKNPLNGKIVGTTHRTKAGAIKAMRELTEQRPPDQ